MTFGLEFALAAALLGPAQQPQKSLEDPAVRRQSSRPTDIAGLYEDIEIMRQLLGRKLRDFDRSGGPRTRYGTQQSSNVAQNGQPTSTVDATANLFLGTVNPFGTTANAATYSDVVNQYFHASASTAHVEGVYLERAGVVFTVTLPLPVGDPRPSPRKAAAAPAADEWEKARRQLRGEKSDATSPAPAQRPTVGDVILRALAENGKHFRRLDNDDRLTVVVTFHRHRTDPTSMNDFQPPSASAQNVGPPTRLNNRKTALADWAEGAAATAPTRDLELLADLHLRQQQYDQALDSLRRAIATVEKDAAGNPDSPDVRKAAQRLSDLLTKLAQALLATGKADEARAALEKSRRINLDLTGTPNAAKPAQPEAAKLPAKLVISARKDLLDAVGSAKMDYETFRQQVTAEYLTFGEEKQKPKP
jgi:hypothetical protein